METTGFMNKRNKTRQVRVGALRIGGDAPVTIQSMTNTRTSDVAATIAQVQALEAAGCDIIRVAVPDMAAAEAIRHIKSAMRVPLVADIHFDWRLAIASMENGVDKIRLNPGNIGHPDRVKAVVDVARERKIPIRIGVNAGSLDRELLSLYGGVCPEALVESAMSHVRILEELNYPEIILSVKSSNVPLSMAPTGCWRKRRTIRCISA